MTGTAFDTALIIAGNWNTNKTCSNLLKFFSPDSKPYEEHLIKSIPELNIPKNFSPSTNSVSPSTHKIRTQSSSSTFKTLSIPSPSGSFDSNSPQKLFGSVSTNPSRQNWLHSSPKPSPSPKIYQKILDATEPINLETKEDILYQGQKLSVANKPDVSCWKGKIPICEYPINEDTSPEIIVKKFDKKIDYDQEIGVRYLRPPTPPDHGDIIIQHEKSVIPPLAPPLVIRQEPHKPQTPPPLIIREAPPKPIKKLETKIIKIPAKKIPPPPRKVIIERLPQIPPKPQPILVERWLPYKTPKRKIIYQKPEDVRVEKPKNVIIQWENPNVVINKKFTNLGIIQADPNEYLMKYKSELKEKNELNSFLNSLELPENINLFNEPSNQESFELIGDLEALNLVDTDNMNECDRQIIKEIVNNYINKSNELKSSNIGSVIEQIIDMVKAESAKIIRYDEAKAIIKSINRKLEKKSSDDEIESYLKSINLDAYNTMELESFKSLIELKFYQ